MLHSNDSNPVHWLEIFSAGALEQLNDQHIAMRSYIEQGSPDSLALAQVRQAQYAAAVSDARRALERVMSLQERSIELAYMEAPHDGLDSELGLLGLK